MNVTEFQTRPIDQWPGELTPHHKRRRSRFKVAYGTLNNELMRELEHLKCRGVALLMALGENDIRLDGRPRAGTRPAHPGVIVVAAETKHGPMRWACDSFENWEANLRAITLTLRNLRMIDDYGCTKRGEQYRGWAALPAPDGKPTTLDECWSVIRAVIGVDAFAANDPPGRIREALRKSHPDQGGSAETFKKMMAAKLFIEAAK